MRLTPKVRGFNSVPLTAITVLAAIEPSECQGSRLSEKVVQSDSITPGVSVDRDWYGVREASLFLSLAV